MKVKHQVDKATKEAEEKAKADLSAARAMTKILAMRTKSRQGTGGVKHHD